MCHSKMLENFQVILGAVSMLWLPRWLMITIYRSHKGYKLPWNDPVEVTILDLLVILILSGIEIFKAVPSKLCRDLQPLQAVIYLKTI